MHLKLKRMIAFFFLLFVFAVPARAAENVEEPASVRLSPYRAIGEHLSESLPKASLSMVRSRGLSVTLYWKPVEGADGYRILKKTDGSDWKLVKRVSKKECEQALKKPKKGYLKGYGYSFSDNENKTAGTCYYTVQAYNKVGDKRVICDWDKTGRAITLSGFDIQTNYTDVEYTDQDGYPRNATVASGGCGPCAIGNILRNQVGIEEADTLTMCELATECGARYNGGTAIGWLFRHAVNRWGGFAYRYVEDTDEMLSLVKKGCMAVAHTYGYYPLFADSGHFVAVTGVDDQGIKIFDSYMPTDRKWRMNQSRLANIIPTDEIGAVYTNAEALDKACDYYYVVELHADETSNVTEVTSDTEGMKIVFSDAAGNQDYHIYRKGPGEEEYTFIGTGNRLTGYYIDETCKNGKKYSYQIQTGSGPDVNDSFGKSKSGVYVKAPVISKAKLSADGELTLSWRSKGYDFEVRFSCYESFYDCKTVKVKGAEQKSLTITDLDSEKTWYVQVRAKKKVGKKTYTTGWSCVKAVKHEKKKD